jgi:DNA-binding MarR family transcriptional regulator
VQATDRGPADPPPREDPAEALVSLSDALLAVTRAVARHRGQGPLDRAAVAVLARVADEGPLRVSDVASALGLDQSTVSRQVQTLTDGGYVAKEPDPGDRRASQVTATGAGRAALDAVRADRAATLGRALVGWDPEDRDRLRHLLTRLSDDLEALG